MDIINKELGQRNCRPGHNLFDVLTNCVTVGYPTFFKAEVEAFVTMHCLIHVHDLCLD